MKMKDLVMSITHHLVALTSLLEVGACKSPYCLA
jgi:hypothetical protein